MVGISTTTTTTKGSRQWASPVVSSPPLLGRAPTQGGPRICAPSSTLPTVSEQGRTSKLKPATTGSSLEGPILEYRSALQPRPDPDESSCGRTPGPEQAPTSCLAPEGIKSFKSLRTFCYINLGNVAPSQEFSPLSHILVAIK